MAGGLVDPQNKVTCLVPKLFMGKFIAGLLRFVSLSWDFHGKS